MEKAPFIRIFCKFVIAVSRQSLAAEQAGKSAYIGQFVVYVEFARIRPRLVAVDHYLGLFRKVVADNIFRFGNFDGTKRLYQHVNSARFIHFHGEVFATVLSRVILFASFTFISYP